MVLTPGSDRPADDDFALMDALASRDEGALSLLYDRHASAVLGVCIRILKERGDAEEVTGEVFTELWERASRYDATRGHPIAYLLNLARSRAIDRLRTRARRDRIIVDADPAEAVASGARSRRRGPSRCAPTSNGRWASFIPSRSGR